MLNEKLINEACRIASNYLADEGIYETSTQLRTKAIEWYSNTEIVEPKQLAAVVISGNYRPGIKYQDIVNIEKMFFPTADEFKFYASEYESFRDEIPIWEIEQAQRDAEWW